MADPGRTGAPGRTLGARGLLGATAGAEESLQDWSSADTWQGRLKGRDAAIETLLPIAAAAFGMTAIGIVLLLVSHHIV